MIEAEIKKARLVMADHGGVMTAKGEKGTNEKKAAQCLGLESIDVGDLNELLKRGKLSNAGYIAWVKRRYHDAPRVDELTDQMWLDIFESMKREPRIFDLLAECRKRGVKTGLLSNNNPVVTDLLRESGWYDGLEPCIVSCEAGLAKPDPEIYERVETFAWKNWGIRPPEILLIDDQKKCTDGAEWRNWKTVLHRTPEQTVREVRALLGWS